MLLFLVAKEKVKRSLDRAICPQKRMLQVIPAAQENGVTKLEKKLSSDCQSIKNHNKMTETNRKKVKFTIAS